MTKDDLHKMLVMAYELGRMHGEAKADLERRTVDEWSKLKKELFGDYEKLTKL
jgi:hypothetical protein